MNCLFMYISVDTLFGLRNLKLDSYMTIVLRFGACYLVATSKGAGSFRSAHFTLCKIKFLLPRTVNAKRIGWLTGRVLFAICTWQSEDKCHSP